MCAIEAHSTTCAVPIENSESYWLSGGCSSVAELVAQVGSSGSIAGE